LLGTTTGRWAKVLRFAHLPATLVEPWPLGATVAAALSFYPGLLPQRALPQNDGHAALAGLPPCPETSFASLLDRFAAALTANPFLHSLPCFLPLRPAGPQRLADGDGRCLPWAASPETALRVEAICGDYPVPACGEWDGHQLHLLAIADGTCWTPLVPLRA
jgi:hypothetical protein